MNIDWTAAGFLATSFGSLGTLLGVWLVLRQVRADHEWRRRQYALDMLKDWNHSTATYTNVILKHFPGLRETSQQGQGDEITKERARQIYLSKGTEQDQNNWELRMNIVFLLNHLEFVAAAYEHYVADRKTIESHLKATVIKWYDDLSNYRMIDKENMKRDSWEPLTELVRRWREEERLQEEKQAAAGIRGREPTG